LQRKGLLKIPVIQQAKSDRCFPKSQLTMPLGRNDTDNVMFRQLPSIEQLLSEKRAHVVG
jgi:hypothetical protein